MNDPVIYLCVGVSVMLLVFFVYLFILDGRVRDMGKRLAARENHDA